MEKLSNEAVERHHSEVRTAVREIGTLTGPGQGLLEGYAVAYFNFFTGGDPNIARTFRTYRELLTAPPHNVDPNTIEAAGLVGQRQAFFAITEQSGYKLRYQDD